MRLPLHCAPLTPALVALWAPPAGAQQPWSGLDAATQIRLAVQAAAQGVSGEERVTARWREWEEGVIYTPMATTASTGIPEQPSAGGPWLMLPATPGAHIMITPPRPGGGR